MTYPPQQPPQQPPWGQQPNPYGQQPDPYGQQPGPYGQQPGPQTGPQPTSSYQGFGTFSGGPQPPKRSTSTIAAIVVGALIVLGGGGAAIYFLTKGDGGANNAGGGSSSSQAPTTTTSDDSTTTDETTTESADSTVAPDGTSPESVREDYILAYESKSFTSVVTNACRDYKSKYGTDTSDVEKKISPYTIVGTPVGDPEVTGDSAMAKIDLEFSQDGGSPQTRHIKVKAVLEDDSWKFCGEASA